jgi:bifunctional UDP-N-acetylglucosamine pyrophosphorylase/glucosamine-1-phosphate N-acetyltransferase
MKALVLAAGEGTRMRPLTASTPKPLLLTAGKPFLEHILDALKGAGIKEVHILAGWMEDRIREHFGDGSRFGMDVRYLVQKERKGTAHAVGMAADVMSEDFVCVNGDIIVTAGTVQKLLEFNATHPANIMMLAEVPNPRDFGVVTLGPGGLVESIEEKPERPAARTVNAGVYIFTRNIFKAIAGTPVSPRGEYEITDTLRMLAAEKLVHGFISRAPWVDVGRPWDLLRANEVLLKDLKTELKGEVEPLATMKGPIRLGEGSIVRNGSYIEGPVSIGRNCQIGPNCYIRPHTTIGDGCKIGAGVELKNSIVMGNTHVPHLNYVGDSVLGQRCNLGAGTVVANLRLDARTIRCTIKGELLDTGQRKLGVIMGDDVKTGINCTIDVGTVIGESSFLGPGATVRGFVEPYSRIQ